MNEEMNEEMYGFDEKCPTLKIGEWVIVAENRLWGIDAYSFETKRDAIFEASGDMYLIKEFIQITSENINHYQEQLEEQWYSDTELI